MLARAKPRRAQRAPFQADPPAAGSAARRPDDPGDVPSLASAAAVSVAARDPSQGRRATALARGSPPPSLWLAVART